MEKKLPKGHLMLWGVLAAAYLVWTIGFVHWDTYPHSETGILAFWQYPVWIVLSTALLGLFPVYMKRFLYGAPRRSDAVIALLLLLVSCGFITVYTFLKNPLDYTASMIGLQYPRCFKAWGILGTASVFVNTMFLYRKYNYRNRAGVLSTCIGCAALFVTINVLSAGEDLIFNSLRCMSHWTGALMFAFGAAAPIVMFLLNRSKTKNRRWIVTTVLFCGMLAVMLTLLVVIGKDGIIEGIPVWSVYIVLLLTNFTTLFLVPQTSGKPQKEPAHV